ncbi:MAG TPA: hypothetical protein VIG72_04250 [Pontibacter sp.]
MLFTLIARASIAIIAIIIAVRTALSLAITSITIRKNRKALVA